MRTSSRGHPIAPRPARPHALAPEPALPAPLPALLAALALTFMVLLAGAQAASAQATPPQIRPAEAIDTPHGRVEFLGLEHWTVEAVLDSLGARAPGAAPAQWGSILLEMGFARTSVNQVTVAGVGTLALVSVIEPHHAATVRTILDFGPPGALPVSWRELDAASRTDNPAFQSAVSLRWFREMQGGMPEFFLENLEASGQRTSVERLWSLLDARTATSDLEDGPPDPRRGRRPGASGRRGGRGLGLPRGGRGLARTDGGAPRSPRTGQLHCQSGAASMLTLRPRPVDWSPAVEGLRALLAGTNIPAFSVLVQTLVSTDVSPSLAAEILPDSENLLLAHLSSTYSPYREPAHRLLILLRGEDLGPDPQPWADWIAGLR
jgi:hypothetical protein